MAIEIPTFLKPKGLNTYFLIEDRFIKGGLRSCTDHADRDAINPISRKPGMVAVTQDDSKIWVLGSDLLTWTEFVAGGTKIRSSIVHTTANLAPGASEDFELPMGSSCLLYNLSVDSGPCDILGYSTIDRTELNPYTFKALPNHLADDGTTYLSDGTTILGRRYSVLMNLEATVSNNIYWTLTNRKSISSSFVVTLAFLPLE